MIAGGRRLDRQWSSQPQLEGGPLSSFRRILVGWDGSEDARRAFRTAAHLAGEIEAEVVVLAVLRQPSHAETADEAAEEMAERRREVMADLAAESRRGGIPASVRLRHEVIEAEHPAPAFDDYVRQHGFDLVVVGRHGIDRAVHARIGGVSEHQVRHGRCPVMVVGAD
jgi:nucleotide-binding universal stress UspA family protein